MSFLRRFGPGLLVTAAFVGPGTVTTATVAGARFGYALGWALLFSIIATIVLQEMAARLGLVTGQGLGEALRRTFSGKAARWAAVTLVVLAIGFGNAAYQAGNITGAALGLELGTGVSRSWWTLLIGALAMALLGAGRYRVIERVLMAMVAVMGIVFVATAAIRQPDLAEVTRGVLVPSVPAGSLTLIMALIGTTVVPYNLFLHASAVAQKWTHASPVERGLREARWDGSVAIALGGLFTLAIMATATAAFSQDAAVVDAPDFAAQLEPLLGRAAGHFFAFGYFAAGLTSAITAPLAAAFAVSGAVGWPVDLRSTRFRATWALIVVLGTAVAWAGSRPTQTIILAQAFNGLMLPAVAVFLLVAMNSRRILGGRVNGRWSNVLGGVVVLVVVALGALRMADAIRR